MMNILLLQALESSDAAAPNNNSEDKPKAELVPDIVKEEEVKPSEAKVEINQIVTQVISGLLLFILVTV